MEKAGTPEFGPLWDNYLAVQHTQDEKTGVLERYIAPSNDLTGDEVAAVNDSM